MQVARWGNSLAVRLPKVLADQMGLKEGDDISLTRVGASRFEVEKSDQRDAALRALDDFRFNLPDDYLFDRDEANAR